jgi:thiamine pyrophosphokinase
MEYGVFRAVNEFLADGEHEVVMYCLHGGKMDDLVVKVRK